MFEELIRRELPATVEELYEAARNQQREDCTSEGCLHRVEVSPSQFEWQHQLRRELQTMAVKVDSRRGSPWRLKASK
jgi:hypothetical protein